MVGTQVPRKRLSDDALIEHPTNRGATGISALNAKADDPACEHVHHHHDPMARRHADLRRQPRASPDRSPVLATAGRALSPQRQRMFLYLRLVAIRAVSP